CKLEEDPSASITPLSNYQDGQSSTFGSPNIWQGGAQTQDFSELRSVVTPGACCFPNDICFNDVDPADCLLIDGSFLGPGLTCYGDPDGDGVFGCDDGCPLDPDKTEPGICGCGVPDNDADSDGVADCMDLCPDTPPGVAVDENGCPILGACCFIVGVCIDNADPGDCVAVGGTYQGNGSTCELECIFPGDFDTDGDTDLDDYAVFADCMDGPVSSVAPGCEPGDFDRSGAVDLRDFGVFQRAFSPVFDCDSNGVPDLCEFDCGTPGGVCDVPGCGQGEDCNTNYAPDECDIADGTSQDANTNGIPDECEECEVDGDCDDSYLCTTDTCVSGLCEWVIVECPVGQGCDPYTGDCVPFNCGVDPDCDDDVFCNGAETCDGGLCTPGENPCADEFDCTDDLCNETTETCTNANNSANCDDGFLCTTDVCDPAASTGLCEDGVTVCNVAADCAAGETCDNDGCVITPNDPVCDDGYFCSGIETCDPDDANADANGCVPGTDPCGGATPVCDEPNDACVECLTDADCDPPTPRCELGTNTCVECLDNTDCTPPETCGGGWDPKRLWVASRGFRQPAPATISLLGLGAAAETKVLAKPGRHSLRTGGLGALALVRKR
ncbi:MAG: hypothetical protein ACYSVY_14290, partial [Planctomycetota bacterium]